VPTLLLMAPVENAVKHGVARSAAGADVEVVAEVVDGRLCIDVVDTGDASVEPQAGGTGLANARARLAALHGGAAGITLRREDGRTRVRVTLPARTQGAA
jgi:LytS/YehU family sensor histidine kinase